MPIPLQGPHQGAQKSTRAGFFDCKTFVSKLLSSISNIFSAITPISSYQSAIKPKFVISPFSGVEKIPGFFVLERWFYAWTIARKSFCFKTAGMLLREMSLIDSDRSGLLYRVGQKIPNRNTQITNISNGFT
jgi:hypothetical protein